MTDNKTTDTKANDDTSKAPERQISVNAQYIRDLSFENPKAPASLLPQQDSDPKFGINVDVKARPVGEKLYEVVLDISAETKRSDETLFIIELSYAGLFMLDNIPEKELEPMLLVYCPGLLFPYARNIISETTRDGGFPALLLDPIDFSRLYAGKRAAAIKAKEESEDKTESA